MRRLIIYTVLIVSVWSCSKEALERSNAGMDKCSVFKELATHCLRDWLIGEDAGGHWEQVGTSPEDISSELIGDNPCIEWSGKACGQYELMYIVGDTCCRDTAYVRPLKCCMTGSSSCN